MKNLVSINKSIKLETTFGKFIFTIHFCPKTNKVIGFDVQSAKFGTLKAEVLNTIIALLNLLVKHKCPISEIVESLSDLAPNNGSLLSLPEAIAQAIKEHILSAEK